MLVYLQEPPNPAYSRRRYLSVSHTIMAPQMPTPLSPLVFDSRTQIIDNCEFLISKDDIVQVITCKDATTNLFKAYAVRCNEGGRKLFLSSTPCDDAQKAVESLHTRSCEAINQYINMYGFSGPRDPKSDLLEPILDDDDAASIISGHSESSTAAFSEWGSSGDEATMLKHAPDAMGAPKERQYVPGRHSSRAMPASSAHEPVGGSRSRPTVREFSDHANSSAPRARASRSTRSPSPSFAFRQAPPLPPPGHPGHPGQPSPDGPPAPPPAIRGMGISPVPPPYPSGRAGGPPPPRPQNAMNPVMPPPAPFMKTCFRVPGHPMEGQTHPIGPGGNRPLKPPGPNANDGNSGNRNSNGPGSNLPRPFSVFHPPMPTYPVRLTVHWLRHGQHRIIAQCLPTRESLQSAAVIDVRMNPDAFTSDIKRAASPNSSNTRAGGRPNLRAQVRQAILAGEPYDLRTFYGQDLTRLFHVMAADGNMPSFEVVVEEVPRDKDDDDEYEEDDDDASVGERPSPPKIERWD